MSAVSRVGLVHGFVRRPCAASKGSLVPINVQRFRGELVLKAHRPFASLNSRRQSNTEEKKKVAVLSVNACSMQGSRDRGTSLTIKCTLLGPYRRPMHRVLGGS